MKYEQIVTNMDLIKMCCLTQFKQILNNCISVIEIYIIIRVVDNFRYCFYLFYIVIYCIR